MLTMKSQDNTKSAVLLTRGEVAKRWSCSTATVRRLEQTGVLSPVKVSARLVRHSLENVLRAELQLKPVQEVCQ